jgi:hypothetical protein
MIRLNSKEIKHLKDSVEYEISQFITKKEYETVKATLPFNKNGSISKRGEKEFKHYLELYQSHVRKKFFLKTLLDKLNKLSKG